ncbi:MAG: HlyD family efflux transporter periplasmic adaptor subunit [Burkholderiales bacterium]|nr:HlyD family efflux transporter periplasmic adaptor subunit [Burkholderiales bacterium]
MGSIRVAAPRLGWWSVAVALALLAALVAFLLGAEASRRVRASGSLLPAKGLIELGLPHAARLVELRVAEGQRVHAGQVLAVLHSDAQTPRGDALGLVERELALRRETLDEDQRNRQRQLERQRRALADRLQSLQAERGRLDGELSLARQRVELARAQVERREGLARAGFVSEAEVQARTQEWLDARQREAQSQRGHEAMGREILSVEAELAALPGELLGQMLSVRRARSEIDQQAAEQQARAVATLRAPADAVVAALNARAGQWVGAAHSIASLLPLAEGGEPVPLQAELLVPSHAAGFVVPGQAVKLRVDAYPYQKFGLVGGHVTSVSMAPATSPAMAAAAAAPLRVGNAQASFRVTVELEHQGIAAHGAVHALRAGMAVQAEMLQERRALWEWLFEPVLAARARAQATQAFGPPGAVAPS